MNTGIPPGAKWFTLCLPFFQYLFFHCKFTISISVSVCRCKSKVDAKRWSNGLWMYIIGVAVGMGKRISSAFRFILMKRHHIFMHLLFLLGYVLKVAVNV